MRWDYMGPKSKDDKSEKIDSLLIIVGVDGLKLKCAHMVRKKGFDPHAIKTVSREIRLAGYTRMLVKSDQEPSILALLEAVKTEREEKRVKSYQRNLRWANTSLMDRLKTQSELCKHKSEPRG